MTLTIKDIVAQAGVPYSMVSRALNDSSPVAPGRKRWILGIAEAMGHVPNHAAVSLRKLSPRMIGFYPSTINKSSSLYALHDVLTGVCSVLGGNHHVIVKGIDTHIPGSLNPSQYDGTLVMSQWDSDTEFLGEVYRKNIPMVAISRQLSIDIPFVVTDEVDGMAQTMGHLLRCGHREIGIIGGPPNLEATVFRYAGWQITAEQQGLSPEKISVEYGNYRYHSGKTAVGWLLRTYPRLTALLCFDDEMALGTKDTTEELGLRVLDDLSLTGLDSLVYSSYSDLRLTTTERNVIAITVRGTRMLL